MRVVSRDGPLTEDSRRWCPLGAGVLASASALAAFPLDEDALPLLPLRMAAPRTLLFRRCLSRIENSI